MELLLSQVQQRGMLTTTYGALYDVYGASPMTVPGRDAWTWQEEQMSGAGAETRL